MSSQVDGHDEARELRSFGYEQQLNRSMGVFSSLSISISCMCITAGIFTVYAYALSTAGPAFVWTWPVVAAGQILVARRPPPEGGHPAVSPARRAVPPRAGPGA